jgi:hypothetical protein
MAEREDQLVLLAIPAARDVFVLVQMVLRMVVTLVIREAPMAAVRVLTPSMPVVAVELVLLTLGLLEEVRTIAPPSDPPALQPEVRVVVREAALVAMASLLLEIPEAQRQVLGPVAEAAAAIVISEVRPAAVAVAAAVEVLVIRVMLGMQARRQTRPLSTLCQWLEGQATLLPLPLVVKLSCHGAHNE